MQSTSLKISHRNPFAGAGTGLNAAAGVHGVVWRVQDRSRRRRARGTMGDYGRIRATPASGGYSPDAATPLRVVFLT